MKKRKRKKHEKKPISKKHLRKISNDMKQKNSTKVILDNITEIRASNSNTTADVKAPIQTTECTSLVVVKTPVTNIRFAYFKRFIKNLKLLLGKIINFPRVQNSSKPRSILSRILISIAIILLNLTVGVAITIATVSILLVLILLSIIAIILGIITFMVGIVGLVLGAMFVFSGTMSLVAVFIGISITCFGILSYSFNIWVLGKFGKGIIKHLKWSNTIILGGANEKTIYCPDNNYASNF